MARFSMRWWPFHPYSDWRVKRKGRQDGLSSPPIPPWESEEHAPFISSELKSVGEHDVQVLARIWNALNAHLKARWVTAEIACRAAVQQAEQAQRAFEGAVSDYQVAHGERPPSVGLSRTLGYGFVMFLLFIFELPLNAVVFRIFGENEVLTLLFTCGVAIVLLLSAHELGRLLRDEQWQNPVTCSFIVGLILLPLLIVGGVAYAREEYLNYLPDMLRMMNPWMIYLAFAAINLAIYAVATILSYRHYERGLDEVMRSTARLQRALRAHVRARQRLHVARSRRIAAFHTYQALYGQIQFEVRRLKGLYQTENLLSRKDRGQEHVSLMPRSFARDLVLTRLPELENGSLDWTIEEAGYLNSDAITARGVA